MLKAKDTVRYLFYGAWSILMTAMTFVLGAATLKVLRRRQGRLGYWIFCFGLSGALFVLQLKVLALAYLSLVILMGFFSELEEVGLSFGWSCFFSVVLNTLVGAGGFALWASTEGAKWSQTVQSYLEAMFRPVIEVNPGLQIDYFEVMTVLPSIAIMLWMGAIYLAVLLEERVTPVRAKKGMRRQLGELRLPDVAVWIFIASLLGTFGGFSNLVVEGISANVLNISFMLLFFQGIAVLARFFRSIRLTVFWQTVFMALAVIYLFMFVGVLGLADYWMDFRSRLAKRTQQKIF